MYVVIAGDIAISFDVLTRGRGGGVGQSRQLNVGWQACAAAESRRAATRMAQVVRCCKYWAATAENCGQGSWSMRWPRSVLKSGWTAGWCSNYSLKNQINALFFEYVIKWLNKLHIWMSAGDTVACIWHFSLKVTGSILSLTQSKKAH